ncbi:alpha/beta hydrolase [Daejeonella sp.]|jgi:acetyl esterase/lipase|uniref:alpha/beta hydrolase n=1 Tax=Daejeonella sp. TaxID=2805397 RepID=UPI00378361A9
MTIFKIIIASFCIIYSISMKAQTIIPLYKGEIPNSIVIANREKSVTDVAGIERISKVSIPTLTLYEIKNKTSKTAAVIICPGGGYGILAASHEGSDVAEEFNRMGITAFVLKYRLPDDSTMVDKSIGPLQDAQRAIQLVRENAEQFGIDQSRIGIMGFSAGGHLAASASTRFKEPLINNERNISLRPDFSVLIYPVISFMDELTHRGSRQNLLGKGSSLESQQKFSNELQVNADTPPAFLVHASDDSAVPVANSMIYHEALLNKKIYSQLLIYPKGGHGFGMNNKTTEDKFMVGLEQWLHSIGILYK